MTLGTMFVDTGAVVDASMSNDELLAAYETLLRRHDWFYNFSDDARYWRAGEASGKRIREVEEALTARGLEAEFIALWNTICPWAKSGERPREVPAKRASFAPVA